MPMLDDEMESLNQLLLDIHVIWEKFENSCKEEDYRSLQDDCNALQKRFERWYDAQSPETQPTTVANLVQNIVGEDVEVGRWPGKIDTYFDLYVASVWNIARTAHLLLLTLVTMLRDVSGTSTDSTNYIRTIARIVEDIASSVPYHLAENLYDFIEGPGTEIREPGRTLGGFLIMYPLHVASKAPFISKEMRYYLQHCLLWITSHMGVGQASVLAKVKSTAF